jgi:hypothetical protein
MKPESINLKMSLTRSTTKKLKKWVEVDSELLALSKNIHKKLKPKKVKRNNSKMIPIVLKNSIQ